MRMRDRYLFKAKTAQIVGIYNNGLEDGVWVHGSLRCDVGKYTIFQFETERADYVEYEIDPSTICQCTGLKDKNGKLIWENDIIHKPFYTDHDAYANSEAYTGRIQYEDGGWSVEITKSDGGVCVSPIIEMIAYSEDIEYCEVIGNIFDNKELLESEEN